MNNVNDTRSIFQDLQFSESVNVHHKNIQILTVEVYHIVTDICPTIMKMF